MKKERPRGIIIGLDHNLDFLKADKHHATNDFVQSKLDFGLIPTVTRPTRITNSSATLIDNIIVSQNMCGAYTSNILINDTSDHLCLEFLNLSKKGTDNYQIKRNKIMQFGSTEETTART